MLICVSLKARASLYRVRRLVTHHTPSVERISKLIFLTPERERERWCVVCETNADRCICDNISARYFPMSPLSSYVPPFGFENTGSEMQPRELQCLGCSAVACSQQLATFTAVEESSSSSGSWVVVVIIFTSRGARG